MATALAQKQAKEEGLPTTDESTYIGKKWISRFLDRHPDLAAKFSNQLDNRRQNASNLITLQDYFDKLTRLIRKLISKGFIPSKDTYNFDEKDFILGYSSKAKVICRSWRWNPNVAQNGSGELITVVEAVSAAGNSLPSWVIYKVKGHYMGWHTAVDYPIAVFAYSENSCTDNVLGLRGLKQHFDPHTAKLSNGRARLLIMDGHGSHLTYEFCSYDLSHEIYFICFPAHSTHLLQPLDVGFFSPLQHYYGKAADTHIRETRTGIMKGMFSKFFTEAKSKEYSKETIEASFRTTGIHPLNPDEVLNKARPTKAVKTVCPIDLHMKTPRIR
ncbi:DDE-domain-containing protein [Morchella conica CCBAS932]|uniref:DDE-domain-containing protein n=1 Tax=Morchella conica CCBAS932 TaxID=1392247 RepID=A0A3N4KN28_9PEZI|nr:DDE-domain-containing protein [Morchella conica CCBAS932]